MSDEARIELSRYKTDELVSRIVEILSIPEAILMVLRTTVFAVVCLIAANSLIYTLGDHSRLLWLFSSVYAIAIALVLGFGLGLIRVASSFLSRVEGLLQLTLKISRAVSEDSRAVSGGEKRMPSASEIVEHVYEEVIMPTVESVVSKTFGFVGKPLLWLYRRTIGGGVRLLITRIKTESLTDSERTDIEQDADGLIHDVGENSSSIERAIDGAMGYTSAATGALRKILLKPMRIVFSLVCVVAIIPLVVFWYLNEPVIKG